MRSINTMDFTGSSRTPILNCQFLKSIPGMSHHEQFQIFGPCRPKRPFVSKLLPQHRGPCPSACDHRAAVAVGSPRPITRSANNNHLSPSEQPERLGLATFHRLARVGTPRESQASELPPIARTALCSPARVVRLATGTAATFRRSVRAALWRNEFVLLRNASAPLRRTNDRTFGRLIIAASSGFSVLFMTALLKRPAWQSR